jgi:hypothetical protein
MRSVQKALTSRGVCYNLAISCKELVKFWVARYDAWTGRKLRLPGLRVPGPQSLARRWRRILGQRVAKMDAWKLPPMESMKVEFCTRVNQAWGGNLIREIKFVAGKPGPKRVPRELDNEHTPFVRRRKG